tara:strand:+ start:759 stop:863 length:105 start_codon:yes stop_codon:yes gene_type:complete
MENFVTNDRYFTDLMTEKIESNTSTNNLGARDVQ